jgi:hypothetical protein
VVTGTIASVYSALVDLEKGAIAAAEGALGRG